MKLIYDEALPKVAFNFDLRLVSKVRPQSVEMDEFENAFMGGGRGGRMFGGYGSSEEEGEEEEGEEEEEEDAWHFSDSEVRPVTCQRETLPRV